MWPWLVYTLGSLGTGVIAGAISGCGDGEDKEALRDKIFKEANESQGASRDEYGPVSLSAYIHLGGSNHLGPLSVEWPRFNALSQASAGVEWVPLDWYDRRADPFFETIHQETFPQSDELAQVRVLGGLNAFFADDIESDDPDLDPAGFAVLPWDLSEAYTYMVVGAGGDNCDLGILGHEGGHLLGLLHTFNGYEEGYDGKETDCVKEGDWICDTLPHAQDSCEDAEGNTIDYYMSYCPNKETFTPIESAVMAAMANEMLGPEFFVDPTLDYPDIFSPQDADLYTDTVDGQKVYLNGSGEIVDLNAFILDLPTGSTLHLWPGDYILDSTLYLRNISLNFVAEGEEPVVFKIQTSSYAVYAWGDTTPATSESNDYEQRLSFSGIDFVGEERGMAIWGDQVSLDVSGCSFSNLQQAIILSTSRLSLSESRFEKQMNGALNLEEVEADIAGCTFSKNTRQSQSEGGGALSIKGGSTEINHTNFDGNTAAYGAAIYALYGSWLTLSGAPASRIAIVDSAFSGNLATWNGAAIWVQGSSVPIRTIEFKSAEGGTVSYPHFELALTATVFDSNASAYGDGGAIWTDRVDAAAEDLLLSANQAYTAGGVWYALDSNLSLDLLSVTGNQAVDGAAFYTLAYLEDAKVILEASELVENIALRGAALDLHAAGSRVNTLEYRGVLWDQNALDDIALDGGAMQSGVDESAESCISSAQSCESVEGAQ